MLDKGSLLFSSELSNVRARRRALEKTSGTTLAHGTHDIQQVSHRNSAFGGRLRQPALPRSALPPSSCTQLKEHAAALQRNAQLRREVQVFKSQAVPSDSVAMRTKVRACKAANLTCMRNIPHADQGDADGPGTFKEGRVTSVLVPVPTQCLTAKHAYLSNVEHSLGDYLLQLELHRQSQGEVHMLAAEVARWERHRAEGVITACL